MSTFESGTHPPTIYLSNAMHVHYGWAIYTLCVVAHTTGLIFIVDFLLKRIFHEKFMLIMIKVQSTI